jgi:hypothetical protein
MTGKRTRLACGFQRPRWKHRRNVFDEGVEHDSRGGCAPDSAIRNPNSKLETGRRTSATVRHSSAPKTGAMCKRNLRQLAFEVFVPMIIVDGNSQICFHKSMLKTATAKTTVHVVMHALRPNTC